MFHVFKLIERGFHFIRKIVDIVVKTLVFILNRVLLTLVYFIGVGPIALSAKMFGKHFLPLKKEAVTYWIQKEKKTINKNDYYRQY